MINSNRRGYWFSYVSSGIKYRKVGFEMKRKSVFWHNKNNHNSLLIRNIHVPLTNYKLLYPITGQLMKLPSADILTPPKTIGTTIYRIVDISILMHSQLKWLIITSNILALILQSYIHIGKYINALPPNQTPTLDPGTLLPTRQTTTIPYSTNYRPSTEAKQWQRHIRININQK